MTRSWAGRVPLLWLLLAVCAGASDGADPLRNEARSRQSYLLVEFVSDSCPSCDEMKPIVDQVLANHPQLRFRKVDADLEVELSRHYEVKCVPVYVVLDRQGEVRFNDVGMRTAEELEQILKQAGVGGH
jgi:thioredoxin 1